MRKIKFRVWDKNREKMIYFGFKDLRGAGYGKKDEVLYINREPFDDKNIAIHEDLIMQFTGLTDKNGVECYEADLVKDIDGVTFSIEYREDYYSMVAIKTENPDWKPTQLKDLKTFEIIGNKYEN